jgi:hypothetical protein
MYGHPYGYAAGGYEVGYAPTYGVGQRVVAPGPPGLAEFMDSLPPAQLAAAQAAQPAMAHAIDTLLSLGLSPTLVQEMANTFIQVAIRRAAATGYAPGYSAGFR